MKLVKSATMLWNVTENEVGKNCTTLVVRMGCDAGISWPSVEHLVHVRNIVVLIRCSAGIL